MEKNAETEHGEAIANRVLVILLGREDLGTMTLPVLIGGKEIGTTDKSLFVKGWEDRKRVRAVVIGATGL